MLQAQVTKKTLVTFSFVLISLIVLGGIFSIVSETAIDDPRQVTSYLGWTVIAYVAGLSMIVLPCTLPLVFIIVPLSMGKQPRRGLYMALLFGAGLTVTITAYGAGVSLLGQTASLDQVSRTMFVIAGIAAFLFGLNQLHLLNIRMPSYSGMPRFIQNRGEYSKSFFMGALLGNAGVGCPNPLFYWLLIHIAGTASLEIGTSLGLVHGIGRAIPLVLMSVLAIVGVNATAGLKMKRVSIEKITGWMLVVLGSFLIINGIPQGHAWYEHTFVHQGWNEVVIGVGLPPEYMIGDHHHEGTFTIPIQEGHIPFLLFGMIGFAVIWYFVNKAKQAKNKEQEKASGEYKG